MRGRNAPEFSFFNMDHQRVLTLAVCCTDLQQDATSERNEQVGSPRRSCLQQYEVR